MLPFETLHEATSAGPGAVRDMEDVRRRITAAVTTSGSPTGGTVYVEGSLDGESWFRLDEITITNLAPRFIGTTSENEHAVRYVRCYLDGLTGGSSPKVTAYVVGADI